MDNPDSMYTIDELTFLSIIFSEHTDIKNKYFRKHYCT